ncbi:MAG TPA: hypothetical protein VKM55_22910 [Candidatus Lokiarchaeia archaeon]|nr:hypothetical protein [Candidatus Lokiarchaeia archaeon]
MRIDEFWSKYQKIKDAVDNPIIIGHNCGFKDYPTLKPYEKETTRHGVDVADYLEIDITKLFGKWMYSHFGKLGSKGRVTGVELSSFLDEFKAIIEETDRKDVGLFLDMKWEFLNDKELDDFMKILVDHDLTTTPIMICLNNNIFKPFYVFSIIRLLRWFNNHQAWFKTCPSTTIVIRSDLHEIFDMVANKLKKWFTNKKLRCAFNPNSALWTLNNSMNGRLLAIDDRRFDFQYMLKHDIASYFWMTDTVFDPDEPYAWLTIKQEIADRISATRLQKKNLQWGIITYKPEQLRNSKNQVEEWIIKKRQADEKLAKENEDAESVDAARETDSTSENGSNREGTNEEDA